MAKNPKEKWALGLVLKAKTILISGIIIIGLIAIVFIGGPQINRLVERYQFHRYQRDLMSVPIKEESIPIYDLNSTLVSGKIEIVKGNASIRCGVIVCAIVKEISRDKCIDLIYLASCMVKCFKLKYI